MERFLLPFGKEEKYDWHWIAFVKMDWMIRLMNLKTSGILPEKLVVLLFWLWPMRIQYLVQK